LGAATAWQQAQLNLRQTNHSLAVIDCNPVVGGKRYLEASAKARAHDGADHGLLGGLQLIEDTLAEFRELVDLFLCLAGLDHADVGTGDEARGLARNDDDSFAGVVVGDLFEDGREFGEHLATEGVHFGVLGVDLDHGDLVLVADLDVFVVGVVGLVCHAH